MSEDLPNDLTGFYTAKPVERKKREIIIDYENDEGYKPKYKIKNLDEFRRGREILGNLIIKKMITSGGTDIDWLIEHNGGFIIFEIKRIWSDTIVIRKGQMLSYQRLQEQLKKCHIIFVAHRGIDFTNPNDYVHVRELKELLKDPALHDNTRHDDELEGEEGYAINVSFMDEMTVDELRDKIDFIWKEFKS